jgi:hypothetical protein
MEKLAAVMRLDARTGQVRWQRPGVAADSLAVSADGRFTVTSGIRELCLLDESGEVVLKRLSSHRRVAIGPDGRTIISATVEGRTGPMLLDTRVEITGVAGGGSHTVSTGDVVGDLLFMNDGTGAAYSWDGNVYRFDRAGTITATATVGAGARMAALPDGDLVAGTNAGYVTRCGPDGTIRWQVRLVSYPPAKAAKQQ